MRRLTWVALAAGWPAAAFAAPFAPPVDVFHGTEDSQAIAVADVDGDGRDDLLMLDRYVFGATSQVLRIALQKPDGSLANPVLVRFGNGPIGLANMQLADMDGDGRLDVVVVETNGLWVLRNAGNLSFERGFHDHASTPTDLAFDDIDGDGHLDVIVATEEAIVFAYGDGEGGIASQVPAGAGASRVHLVDANGDGRHDLVSSRANAIDVALKSDAGFAEAYTLNVTFADHAAGPAFADFDGDGRMDFAAVARVEFAGRGTPVTYFRQLGNGRFLRHQQMATHGYPGNLEAVDLDGDGTPELVVPHLQNSSIMGTYAFEGGRFGVERWNVGVSSRRHAGHAFGDVNGDGRIDMLVARFVGGVQILYGTTEVLPVPDLAVELALTEAATTVGYANVGELSTESAQVGLALNARVGVMDIALPASCELAGDDGSGGVRRVRCTLAALAPGASGTLVFPHVQLDRSGPNAIFASVKAVLGGEPHPHNNVARGRVYLRPMPAPVSTSRPGRASPR